MDSDSEKPKIKVAMIFDAIGRPPEHLVESLGKLVDEIDREKGVNVSSKKIQEPILMKDSKEFYTTFAEVEAEIEEIIYLTILLFKYMPAHIEVIEPEILALSNGSWNEVLNELARRLHGYDEIARMMQAENQELRQKIAQITGKQVITPLTPKSEVRLPQPKSTPETEKKVKSKKPAKKKAVKKSNNKKSVKK